MSLRPARGERALPAGEHLRHRGLSVAVRLGLVGGGWISRLHLEALERLGRTELVGVVAGSRETAEAVTSRFGGTAYDALDRMLDAAQPDCVYVAVPPHRAVEIGTRLTSRRFPFLTEKP